MYVLQDCMTYLEARCSDRGVEESSAAQKTAMVPLKWHTTFSSGTSILVSEMLFRFRERDRRCFCTFVHFW